MSPTRATLVWCLVGTMALMTIVSFALARLTVDFSSPWLPLAITCLFGMSIFYRYRRPDPHLCAVTEAAAQMLLILLFGILLTYAAIRRTSPIATPSSMRSIARWVWIGALISISSTAGHCWPSLLAIAINSCCRSSRWCRWC
jgi:hypothetical protein